MKDYSTKRINEELIKEIVEALKNIRGWGSVEINVWIVSNQNTIVNIHYFIITMLPTVQASS